MPSEDGTIDPTTYYNADEPIPYSEHTSTEHIAFQDTYVECTQPKQALKCPTTVALNAPFDSGYGSLGELVLDSKDDDIVSVQSLMTNASQVNFPAEEKKNIIVAFAADLCQDIGFSKYRPDERGRILASVSNLLKSFALRLEKNATSKAEHTAKEFLRQQRA